MALAVTQGTIGERSKGTIKIKLTIPHELTRTLTATTKIKTVTEGCAIVSRVSQATKAYAYSDSSPNMLSLNCANFETPKKNDLTAIVYELDI